MTIIRTAAIVAAIMIAAPASAAVKCGVDNSRIVCTGTLGADQGSRIGRDRFPEHWSPIRPTVVEVEPLRPIPMTIRDVILNAAAAECVQAGYEGDTPVPTTHIYSWRGRVVAVALAMGLGERQAWRVAAECKKTVLE